MTTVELLENLAKSGVFGFNGDVISIQPDPDRDLAFQFGSEIRFYIVHFSRNGSLKIVVKTQMSDEGIRVAKDSNVLFHNEISMYTDILPFLNPDEKVKINPKLYYGLSTLGQNWKDDIIILQNVQSEGFKLNTNKAFVNFEHVAIAMKKIGLFHSWSYTAKCKDPENFEQIKSTLKNVTFKKNEEFDFETGIYRCMEFGIQPFIDKGISVNVLETYLEIVKPVFEIFKFFKRPIIEKFAVIVHGDFCKNNIFFKYDTNDNPIDCCFFDFQMSFYGCPVTDLAFFLYMHTDPQLRSEHWNDFLQIYWNSVEENVPIGVQLPSYSEFLEYFSKKAVYGYLPCSFFLPGMLDEQPQKEIEDYKKLTQDERISQMLHSGGEMGRRMRNEVVKHMLDQGYFQKFIDFYNDNCGSISDDPNC